jgi:hypothetical protein
MARRGKTTLTWGDYEVSGVVTPGTKDHFDRAWGNWLPGDGPEVDDLTVRDADGLDVTGALSDEDLADIGNALCERAGDDEADAYDYAEEQKADAARERSRLGD